MIYLANLIIPRNQIKCHLIVIFVAAIIMRTISRIIFPLLTILLAGCVAPRPELRTASAGYARYFDIVQADSCVGIVTIAPSGSFSDTMWVDRPLESIICMSTSHVAALSAIDAISVVKKSMVFPTSKTEIILQKEDYKSTEQEKSFFFRGSQTNSLTIVRKFCII
jgi:hypothetical protein